MYDVEKIISEPLLLEPLRRSVEGGEPPAYLRSAKLHPTARCNLRCVMCHHGQRRGAPPPELETGDFLRIIDELADLGCRKIVFSGGEVLLRGDLERLLERAVNREVKVGLNSNLTLLDKARAKALIRLRVSTVATSIDGPRAKLHDEIRGVEGAFKATLKGLERLVKERERRGRALKIRVHFTMSRRNFERYPEVIRLAAEGGADEVLPLPVRTERPELRLSQRLIGRYNREIAPAVREALAEASMAQQRRLIFPFGQERKPIKEAAAGRYALGFYRGRPCFAPFLHLFVAWDGAVSRCCLTQPDERPPLGDLSRQGVAEVFRGEAFQRARREMLIERLSQCHRCAMFLRENWAIRRALQAPASSASARTFT